MRNSKPRVGLWILGIDCSGLVVDGSNQILLYGATEKHLP